MPEEKEPWLYKRREGKNDFGYNARTDVYENLLETGVIDPAKVARSERTPHLLPECSHTECVITDIKKKILHLKCLWEAEGWAE